MAIWTPPSGGTVNVGDFGTAAWADTYVRDNTQYLYDNIVPIGVVLPYSMTNAPSTSWLVCNGQAVSRTTYAALWDLFRQGGSSSPHGNGNGSTTFNVPDLKGKMPIGLGQGSSPDQVGGTLTNRTLAQQGGQETHVLAGSEMPSHGHTYATGDESNNHHHLVGADNANGAGGMAGLAPGGSNYAIGYTVQPTLGVDPTNLYAGENGGHHHHAGTTDPGGGGAAHNVMQPFLVLNYIVKAI